MATTHRELLIYGAGGHGRVVAESAAAAGFAVRGFLDDRLRTGTAVGPWQVVGRGRSGAAEEFAFDLEDFATGSLGVIVGVGDNAARWHLMNVLRGAEAPLASVIDPTARVSPSATIGPGVYIAPAAVVNAGAVIGVSCIVNTAAVVEHDVELGNAVHVGPTAVVTGRSQVGDRALIGANATILPGRLLGEEAIVGAAAVVTHDVPSRTTVIGCPARPKER